MMGGTGGLPGGSPSWERPAGRGAREPAGRSGGTPRRVLHQAGAGGRRLRRPNRVRRRRRPGDVEIGGSRPHRLGSRPSDGDRGGDPGQVARRRFVGARDRAHLERRGPRPGGHPERRGRRLRDETLQLLGAARPDPGEASRGGPDGIDHDLPRARHHRRRDTGGSETSRHGRFGSVGARSTSRPGSSPCSRR